MIQERKVIQKRRVRPRALPRLVLSGVIFFVLQLMFSCSDGGSSSPYNQSYIEFKLSSASQLGYDDLQSIKVYADPYAAFNLLNIHENGRSLLGAYDYTEESKIYMGFEYSPLYVCRLEELRVSVTKKGSQEFIDSADYTLSFQGEMPESAGDKPTIEISVTEAGVLTLLAKSGIAGAPPLTREVVSPRVSLFQLPPESNTSPPGLRPGPSVFLCLQFHPSLPGFSSSRVLPRGVPG